MLLSSLSLSSISYLLKMAGQAIGAFFICFFILQQVFLSILLSRPSSLLLICLTSP